MGILINALSIIAGSFLGCIFKDCLKLKNFTILSINIMIISLVGFFENIFDVEGIILKSNELLVIVFALIIGTVLGDMMQLEVRISNISSFVNDNFSGILDAVLFFGIGGLQICGPILLATVGDNSQLILKSLIDFPFALMFSISYGKKIALSAVPVTTGQLLIALLAVVSKDIVDTAFIKQLCAMGYIILFFSGFNLICDKKYKINNVNMIVGVFIILLYNVILKLWR